MKNLILLLTISLTSIQSFAQHWTEVWDTITFEKPYEYLVIDTSSQNIWQIGEPNKTFFDSAYSINNAIVTDTLNYYPINNYSYFDLKIGAFNYNGYYPDDIFIEIKHKIDTDTLRDGGFITVSYDQGLTWMNIINDTVYGQATPSWDNLNLYNNYDTLYNGEFGFSGHSNDWITTMFSWHDIMLKNNMDDIGDTMIVRFNFISDNIENNKEGWMIDNIKLYSTDLGFGINDIKSLKFMITPNPMNKTAIIELNRYNRIEFSIFNIQGQLVRQKNYFNNQSIIINRGKLNSGIYFIKIRTNENLVGIRKLILK
ncbi:MAG: T9SS type A sorting domain-containing protein [Bacteroidales bacterium]|nr:T9SS type A sorting domain-containing protein [Bacteroidales bacterium]